MNDATPPIESEFATPDEAAAYDVWLRAKVSDSIADPRPSIPHDEVMLKMRERVASVRKDTD